MNTTSSIYINIILKFAISQSCRQDQNIASVSSNNAVLDIFSDAEHRIDICGNSKFLSLIFSFESIRKAIFLHQKRDIRSLSNIKNALKILVTEKKI